MSTISVWGSVLIKYQQPAGKSSAGWTDIESRANANFSYFRRKRVFVIVQQTVQTKLRCEMERLSSKAFLQWMQVKLHSSFCILLVADVSDESILPGNAPHIVFSETLVTVPSVWTPDWDQNCNGTSGHTKAAFSLQLHWMVVVLLVFRSQEFTREHV